MNILFVNNGPFRMFDRLDSGASVRNTLFVRALSQLGHVDVISFHRDELKSNIENCDVINAWVPKAEKRDSFRGKGWLDLIFRPFSPFTYFPVDENKEEFIDGYWRAGSYDYIACRYIYNAAICGLFKYRDKLIIDLDDNPAKVYKLNMKYNSFRYMHKRLKYRIQTWTIGGMVRKQMDSVFCSFYSNPLEKPSPKSVLLYNTTTIKDRIDDITDATPYRILIVGWLDYYPNKEGSRHFVANIFPLIKSALPEAELHIAGKCSDPSVIEGMNDAEGVKALGFVDDIAREYRESRVIVIPVYHGSGTSVKFIEGVMVNRPIVSTPLGARGFEHICKEGEHYLEATDDNDFTEKVIRLLKSTEESKRLAHNALQLGRRHFSQEGFMSTVRETVTNLVKSANG